MSLAQEIIGQKLQKRGKQPSRVDKRVEGCARERIRHPSWGGGGEGREVLEKRKMSVKVRRKEGKAGGKQEAAVQMEGIG